MGLGDILASFVNLILYVCYGVYIAIGIACIALGIVFLQREGSQQIAGGIMVLGIFMFIIGIVTCLVIKMGSNSWGWMALTLILIVNLAILVALYAVSITAIFIGAGYSDPIDDFVDDFWTNYREQESVQTSVDDRAVGYCESVAVDSCEDYYSYAADGNMAETFTVSAPTLTELQGNIKYYAWNCELLVESFDCGDLGSGTGELTSPIDCGIDDSVTDNLIQNLYNFCTDCDEDCKESMKEDLKTAVRPAAFIALIIFASMVGILAWNNMLIHFPSFRNDDGKFEVGLGPFTLIAYAVNGLLVIFGILLIAIGGASLSQIQKTCPDGEDCPGLLNIAVMCLGGFIFLAAGLVIFSVVKSVEFTLVLGNLLLTLFAFLIGFVVIALGLSAEVLSTASALYDDNWTTIRDSTRKIPKFEEFCYNTDSAGELVEMSDVECQSEVEDFVRGNMRTIGISCITLCGFIAFVLFVTLKAVHIWKNSGDGEDEVGVGDVGDSEGGEEEG